MISHERIYEEMATAYDEMISRQPDLGSTLREIRPWTGLDALDLGAGSGRLSLLLAQEARSLVCTDGSAEMLKLLDRKLLDAGVPRIWKSIVADHMQLPFEDGSFDYAVAGWTIGYVANTDNPDWQSNLERIMDEIHRVLKPGGTIVIMETMGTGTETPNPPAFLHRYYNSLVHEYGFSHRWIRTDYRFSSIAEAKAHTEFFFGTELAARIDRNGWSTVPECAGIWWKHI
ncbi:class I SAM-dependent methyltransferase [Cohnella sp. GCM10027633]|uniref:class I SAM-dependent methyltransferase n=1 Tax=unclassified Cohnella TaxID=2636738 RepID=UPI00363E86DE